MRILVPGGAGYIGSHVVRALHDRGDTPVVFDSLKSGRRTNLPEASSRGGSVPLFHGDVRDRAALDAAFAAEGPFDAVVHFAAEKAAGASMTDPQRFTETNVVGSTNLVHAALAAGCHRLVFSSTAAVYGEPRRVPIDERHPTEPANWYGHTKLAVERLLGWYGRLTPLKSVALRYFNAAGLDPAGRILHQEPAATNLIPVVLEVAAGLRDGPVRVFGDAYDTPDGTGVRDYVHVSDLATAHLAALDDLAADASTAGAHLALNLGTGDGHSVHDVLAAARRITGREIPSVVVPPRPGDPARVYASAEAARERWGWAPRHSGLDELISTSWAAYAPPA
ncbi:UDP-glucose 4-epimerase GalE [Phycisphaera mikurensis]|uniref:UDP-glucose 4-epimerase n=1 Tax=Phycisphaera mikurensis (strain NBRC 102666 / KCTC 22515 / FYK2301M01) TaxID=1142394 RepID=I0IFK9_PHYMF|nr:UDP-glucose 4-epimerase GalE [Phycisphaera mikurensis]MBB6440561.1 UDP-glucose 4-epimerase [Phycisphaera mikurensis]BAM04047.1 putative UDP-glucose 4-epimerase [Phycisphaera mikurensis NBRC 102666]